MLQLVEKQTALEIAKTLNVLNAELRQITEHIYSGGDYEDVDQDFLTLRSFVLSNLDECKDYIDQIKLKIETIQLNKNKI